MSSPRHNWWAPIRKVSSPAPSFLRWWQDRGFSAGSTTFDGFTKLLADPFLDSTIQKAAQFYEADLPQGTTFQIHVLVQPASSRKLSVAYQLEGDSVVETPEGEKPEDRIEIIAHELFHYLFFRMDPKRQSAMLESVCGSDDPLAAVAFGMLDEAVAAALGNGVVGQHYKAKPFLKEHPFISVAALVPDAAGTSLESLGLADRHAAAVSSVTARTRGFVYAVPRTAKSYAFAFVAGDSKTMDSSRTDSRRSRSSCRDTRVCSSS